MGYTIKRKAMKYKCECKEFEIKKATLIAIKGKIETKEAYCKECNTYGKVVKEFDGWGTIVSKEGGKV